jgi:hypothetical protein
MTFTRRRWTDASIEATLAPIVADLGRMPTRSELTARDAGGAWAAMRRHGGVDAWRARLLRPRRDDIERRAYFIALERGGDPVDNWLTAEAELTAA